MPVGGAPGSTGVSSVVISGALTSGWMLGLLGVAAVWLLRLYHLCSQTNVELHQHIASLRHHAEAPHTSRPERHHANHSTAADFLVAKEKTQGSSPAPGQVLRADGRDDARHRAPLEARRDVGAVDADCVGAWSTCASTCSDKVYTVHTRQFGTGKACEAVDGATAPCVAGEGDCAADTRNDTAICIVGSLRIVRPGASLLANAWRADLRCVTVHRVSSTLWRSTFRTCLSPQTMPTSSPASMTLCAARSHPAMFLRGLHPTTFSLVARC